MDVDDHEVIKRYLRLRLPEHFVLTLRKLCQGADTNSGLNRILALLDCHTLEARETLLKHVAYAQLYAKINTDGSTAHYTNEPHRNFATIEHVRLRVIQITEINTRQLWLARHRVLQRVFGIHATDAPQLQLLALQRHDELERNGTGLGADELGKPLDYTTKPAVWNKLHEFLAELSRVPAALVQDMLSLPKLSQTAKLWLAHSASVARTKQSPVLYVKNHALYHMAAALTLESERSDLLVGKHLQKAEQTLTRAANRLAKAAAAAAAAAAQQSSKHTQTAIMPSHEYYSETLILGDARYPQKDFFLISSETCPAPVLHPLFWQIIMQQMVCYDILSLESCGEKDRFWCVFTGEYLQSPSEGLYVIYKFAYLPSIVCTVSLRYFQDQRARIKLVLAGYSWQRIAELMPLQGAEYELVRAFFATSASAGSQKQTAAMSVWEEFMTAQVTEELQAAVETANSAVGGEAAVTTAAETEAEPEVKAEVPDPMAVCEEQPVVTTPEPPQVPPTRVPLRRSLIMEDEETEVVEPAKQISEEPKKELATVEDEIEEDVFASILSNEVVPNGAATAGADEPKPTPKPSYQRLRKSTVISDDEDDKSEPIVKSSAPPKPAAPKQQPPQKQKPPAPNFEKAEKHVERIKMDMVNALARAVGNALDGVVSVFTGRPAKRAKHHEEAEEVAEGDEEESGDEEPPSHETESLIPRNGVVAHEAASEEDSKSAPEDDDQFVVDEDFVEFDEEAMAEEMLEQKKKNAKKRAAAHGQQASVLHVWKHDDITPEGYVLAPLTETIADLVSALFRIDVESGELLSRDTENAIPIGKKLLFNIGTPEYEDIMNVHGLGNDSTLVNFAQMRAEAKKIKAPGKRQARLEEIDKTRNERKERYTAYCLIRTVLKTLFAETDKLAEEFNLLVHTELTFDKAETTWDVDWRPRVDPLFLDKLALLLEDDRAGIMANIFPGLARLEWDDKYMAKLFKCSQRFNLPAKQMLFTIFESDYEPEEGDEGEPAQQEEGNAEEDDSGEYNGEDGEDEDFGEEEESDVECDGDGEESDV